VFPILFSYGPVTIKTMSFFMVLAFLASAFIFWKRGREEHYREDQLFDGFLMATVFGLLAARAGYVIFNFATFGFSIIRWVDFLSYPGLSGLFGLIAGGWYLYRYAGKNRWDGYEILDFWAIAATTGLIFTSVGAFFDGSGYGYATSLPVGVTFPSLIEPHHPVQLYFFLFYLVLCFYLFWAEYHYRTFEWYRYGKKTAQTGFLISTFIIVAGLANFIFAFFKPPTLTLYGINLDMIVSLAAFVAGVMLLYVRSGRVLPFSAGSKKKRARLRQFQQAEKQPVTQPDSF